MKTYIYSSKNIVKTLYCDEKQILRADYENTLTGRKTRADLYGFEICYSESLSGVKKYFREINPDELHTGDIITTKYRGVLHIGVYLDYGKIIHVFKSHTLQIGRLKMFKDFQSYRVK